MLDTAYRKSDLQPGAATQSDKPDISIRAVRPKQIYRAREIHGEIGNQEDVVSSCRPHRMARIQK